MNSFAQGVYIPDANFKNTLIALGVDTNSDGEIQFDEALNVTSLTAVGANIADFTGIESFTNLTEFFCYNNSATSLDVSNLASLQLLRCENNQISTLNLSGCTSLSTLYCHDNLIIDLNTSGLTNLIEIYTQNNPQLTSINTSGCTSLAILNMYETNISPSSFPNLQTVDISNCIALQAFRTVEPNLSSFITSGCSSLANLEIVNSQLTALDFTDLTSLVSLDCTNNSTLTSLNLSGLASFTQLVCMDNELTTLNLDGCVNLIFLSCYNNQIAGELNLSNFSQLISVECHDNNFSSINLSNCPSLEGTTYSLNQFLTSVDLSNCPSLLSDGGFAADLSQSALQSLNLSNCTSIQEVNVSTPQLQNINLSGCSSLSLLNMNSLVSITSLDLSGLTSLENFVINNTSLTSINVSGCINLNVASLGNNNLTAIDFSNTPSITEIYLENNQITELDVSGNPNLQTLNISNNPLINLFAKNGANETISFFGNPNLQFVCVDESQVAAVQTELDTAGLTSTVCNSYCSFTPGGNYNTISGILRYDSNSDGCDTNDATQSLVRVNIAGTTSNQAVFTNAMGQYQRYVLDGDYTVTPILENPIWFFSTPTDATITFPDTNNNTEIIDFCIAPTPPHTDVEVVIAPIVPARPGFNATYLITYKNKGNTVVSGQVTFNYDDAVLDYISSTVVPATQNIGALVFDYSNLQPLQTRSFQITLNVNSPQEIPAVTINDELMFGASIVTDLPDENSEDNLFVFNQTVVGSYDPNDITCVEGEVVPSSEIGEYLHYIINFENTGTAEAENVVVKVDIDESQFDIDSLQLLNTSHTVDARINGNKVEFIFQEIWLDTGGHGNVLLKIRSKHTLSEGDTVAKQANIYFDYNFPIETNMANTTFEILSNGSFAIDASITVFPNPTASIINVNCNNTIKTVELYDVQGRLLQTQIVDNATTSLDISNKTSGIYFAKITSENGVKVEKISKE